MYVFVRTILPGLFQVRVAVSRFNACVVWFIGRVRLSVVAFGVDLVVEAVSAGGKATSARVQVFIMKGVAKR